jgi:hypothetical protein
MPTIQIWEDKIKEKRKKTPWKKFVREIVSWCNMVFQKNNWLISKYPSTDRIKISPMKQFNENNDNLVKLWVNYDENKSLLDQFWELLKSVELPNFFHYNENENCNYAEASLWSKNCYLTSFTINDNENIFYSFRVQKSKNIYNSVFIVENNDTIYFCRWTNNSYKIFYSNYISNSNNIWFSSNLNWCSECIFCKNLDNVSYHINNKKYEKEEYLIEKEKILKNKNDFLKSYTALDKIGKNIWSKNIMWNYIIESENVENGAFVSNNKNTRNVMFTWSQNWAENYNDVFVAGGMWWNDYYGIHSAGWWSNVFCSVSISFSSNIYYSYFLENCSFCLWCIGLKNKSFCILNKQYTKEEWYELADKIFAQMDSDWILWDFFPWSLNPFYFNDTMAYLIDDSFTKEEVEAEWYMWRDEKIKVDIPENAEIVEVRDLSSFQGFDSAWNWQIDNEILKKVIKDENGNIYKIVPMEYDFLMKHSLPLPEIHWLERIKLGFRFK